MWEFRAGNTFGATAFTSYGAFWLSFYGIFKLNVPIAGTDAHNAIGLYLLMWGIVTLYLLIASLRTNAAVAVVFLTLTITFFLLAIGEFQTAGKAATYVSSWTKIGGYLGIITAACAYYASFAEVTNATWGRTVLPVVPMTANRPALAMGRRRA
jgi:succinate-acetate transporter protein